MRNEERKRKKEGEKMLRKKEKRKRALAIYEWIERNLFRRGRRNSNRMFLMDMDNIPSLSFHSILFVSICSSTTLSMENRKNSKTNARKRKKKKEEEEEEGRGEKEVERIRECTSFIHPSFSNKLKGFDEMLFPRRSRRKKRGRRKRERSEKRERRKKGSSIHS